MQKNWIPKLLNVFASILLFVFSASCSHRQADKEEAFVVFLVDAPHLDTRSTPHLLKSLIRNPASREGGGFVGHAWFYAQGHDKNGELKVIEGGHSGELGIKEPRYFDGIMNYVEYGVLYPTAWDKKHPRYEPNPIQYLWANLGDGFFQEGNGGHQPTFAAKLKLSDETFQRILTFVTCDNYSYTDYRLKDHQCVTLVVSIAELLNLKLEHQYVLRIPPQLKLKKGALQFWKDPYYSHFELSSPDVLENSLKCLVKEGKMENATKWYLRKDLNTFSDKWCWHWDQFAHSWRTCRHNLSFFLNRSDRSRFYTAINPR